MNNPSIKQGNRLFPLLLALVLLLVFGLRIYHLGNQSLSREEGISAQAAGHSIAQIAETASQGLYSPGYPILLAGWRALAGSSEFGLRLFSTLTGLLTAALVYSLGKRLFNRVTGLLAVVAVAINPLQIYAGQDATQVAWLGLLSIVSLVLAYSLMTVSGSRLAKGTGPYQMPILATGYVLTNAAGLYTHYHLFSLLILAETLAFLVWLTRHSRKWHGITLWIGLQSATLLLFAPWLPVAGQQLISQPAQALDLPLQLKEIAYGFMLPPDGAQSGLVPLLLLVAIGLFPPIEASKETSWHPIFFEKIGLIALWCIVSVITLVWIGNTNQRASDVLVPANLALMVLAARGTWLLFEFGTSIPALSRKTNRWIQGTAIVMVALALLPVYAGLRSFYADLIYAHDDYRSIAARIQAEAGTQAAVILEPPEQYDVFAYYYPDTSGIVLLPNEDIDGTLGRLVADHRRIYAVFWNVEARDPARAVGQFLETNALIANTGLYGSTQLVSYAVTGTAATKPQTASNAHLGDSFVLDGFALSATTLGTGEGLGITLFWHTIAPLESRYKVFVHLYGPDGTLIAQHDGEPANSAAPTDGWLPDETIIDHHKLLMPDAPPGIYQLVVGMYDQNGTRLPVSVDGQPLGDHLIFADITTP